MMLLSPALADEAATPYIPKTMEVTGAVVVETPQADPRNPEGHKLGSCAIVNGKIWREGQTLKVERDADHEVTLTLTKVVTVEGEEGRRKVVLTFTVELTRHLEKPTFIVVG